MNTSPRLYNDLAWVFRLISPPADYEHEAQSHAEQLQKHARIPVKKVLNLGCGAGHHDFALKRQFDLTGADISEGMLSLARELNPEVRYVLGDMRTLRLAEQFDAVTIFDSIDYMRTPDELRQAFETAFVHLKPGGVLLTIPDELAENFRQNQTQIEHCADENVNVTFVEHWYDPNPSDTTVEVTFVMLIRRNQELTVESETHVLGLFPEQTWIDTLAAVGFGPRREVYVDEHDRAYSVFIGVKEQI